MTLAIRTLLGPYRIQSSVGAGGMGEVRRPGFRQDFCPPGKGGGKTGYFIVSSTRVTSKPRSMAIPGSTPLQGGRPVDDNRD
jgi:hypothetical protein